MSVQGVAVDLRDDQRHVGAHPKVRAVVNHDRAALDRLRAERHRRALLAFRPRKKGNINALKRLRRRGLDFMGQAVHMDGARRTGKNLNARGRKPPLGKDAQQFFPHRADADNGDVILRHDISSLVFHHSRPERLNVKRNG